MVRFRAIGVSPSKIAALYGTDECSVIEETKAVMKADLLESGEPIQQVIKHYWRIGK